MCELKEEPVRLTAAIVRSILNLEISLSLHYTYSMLHWFLDVGFNTVSTATDAQRSIFAQIHFAY